MPNIEYLIHDPPGLVVVRMHGHIRLDDVLLYFDELGKDAGYREGMDKLVDLRGVDRYELQSADVKELIRYKSQFGIRERRLATVAPTDMAFGLNRVYQMTVQGEEVGVFRKLDEALSWLGVPPELVE